MKDRDFLWCGLHLLLDEEEEFARLCNSCQTKAQENRCVACGALPQQNAGSFNQNFDLEQFYARQNNPVEGEAALC